MKLKILEVRDASGEIITSPESVARIMAEEAKADREYFWILHLTTKNQIIEKELVSIGTLSSALVHPREVFKKAVLNSTASIITVHNHPSGHVEPSIKDRELWERLENAGEILGIIIIDHLIITPHGAYYSRKEKSYETKNIGEYEHGEENKIH